VKPYKVDDGFGDALVEIPLICINPYITLRDHLHDILNPHQISIHGIRFMNGRQKYMSTATNQMVYGFRTYFPLDKLTSVEPLGGTGKAIYPPITELEYDYLKARGLLWELYPECTDSYEVDKGLFKGE
jgi:hypothetical protein